jgi:hypothetical protein
MEVKVHINNVEKQNYMVNYIKRKNIWSIKYKFLNKTIYMVNSYKQCFKNRTEPVGRTGQTANRRGDWSGSNVGSAMQLDRWKPLKTGKTGEPTIHYGISEFFKNFMCHVMIF